MTTQEILTKAIKKSFDQGWEGSIQWMAHVIEDYTPEYDYSGLIYNHDFARALWGGTVEHFHTGTGVSRPPIETWKWHLQQMVVADDPIKYLEEHL